ncbi:MAG: cupin domain-containing protein [Anaerolineae bacterium]|jgi:quercetin dioxygenase-like cupin family protein|nr:cupin domain-containing protein [Chloroflexota bacterium]
MTEATRIKNMPIGEAVGLADLVSYAPGQVVSRTLAQNERMSITLFALDAGEAISTHITNGDALVVVLDGEVLLEIGDARVPTACGQATVMPSGVPHALYAEQRFKMLLMVVK